MGLRKEGVANVSCSVSRLRLIPGWLIFQQEYLNYTKDRDKTEREDKH